MGIQGLLIAVLMKKLSPSVSIRGHRVVGGGPCCSRVSHILKLGNLAKVWDGVLGERSPWGSPVQHLLGVLALAQSLAEIELRLQ